MWKPVRAVAVAAAVLACAVAATLRAAESDTWEIVALGPNDEPVPGVVLCLKGSTKPFAETDRDGRATVTAPDGGTTLHLFVKGTVASELRDVDGPKSVLRFPDARPIEVVVVDARTRRPLAGATVALQRLDKAPFPLERTGDVHRLRVSPAHVGQSFSEILDILCPPGFAATGADVGFLTAQTVVGRMRVGRIEIPAWPAGSLRVHVVDTNGAPVACPLDVNITVAGECQPTRRLELNTEGRAVVERIPLIGRGSIAVEIFGTRATHSPPVPLRPDVSEYDAEIVLPDKTPSRAGGCGGSPAGSASRGAMPAGGTARLEIHAVRHDGSPARRCAVLVGRRRWEAKIRTDDRGVATLDHVPVTDAGGDAYDVVVELVEPGVVPTSTNATLDAGETQIVELREPEGATIELTVVDDDGAPVPWARVAASRTGEFDSQTWRHAVIDGDVQDLAPHTDADGRFVFRNVPPGGIHIEASFGERRERDTFSAGSPATLVLAR